MSELNSQSQSQTRSEITSANPGLAARLGAKARKYYEASQTAARERDAARKEAEDLRAKLADTAKLADSNASRKEAEDLRAELRTIRHRSKFDEAAKAAKVRPEALDDLWNISGYKAESDEVDPSKIEATIKEQQAKRAYLFGSGEQEQANGSAPPIPIPGPGNGQGGRQSGGTQLEGKLQVSKVQMRDPAFMRQYQKSIAAAQASGSFELID